MADIWFLSDLHLDHANVLRFEDDNGKLIRPGFLFDIRRHDELILDNINKTVKPQDKFYLLGDVFMGWKPWYAEVIQSMNGHKRLIVGNHDDIKKSSQFFEKVYLWRIFKEHNFTCSHIPLRRDQLRHTSFNVHGHIHQNLMSDKAYINVCVEHTNYTPVHLDTILERINSYS